MSKDKRGVPSAKVKPIDNTPSTSIMVLLASIVVVCGLIIAAIMGQSRFNPSPIVLADAVRPTESKTPLPRVVLPATFTPTASFTPAPSSTPRPTSTPYASNTPPPQVMYTPAMRVQSGAIAYVQDGDIYTIDPLTEQTKRLIEKGSDPLWSPDGRWIAYTRYFAEADSAELMVAQANGRDERQLSVGGIFNFSYQWLPNSQGLVFVNRTLVGDNGKYSVPPMLHLVPLDGGSPKPISQEPLETAYGYEISSDSTSVLYTSSTTHTLRQIDLVTGSEQSLVTSDATTMIRNAALSPDDNHVAYIVDGSGPLSGLYISSIPKSEPTQLEADLDLSNMIIGILGWSPDSRVLYWQTIDNQRRLLGTDIQDKTPRFDLLLPEESMIGWPRIASNGMLYWVTGNCSPDGDVTASFVHFYALPHTHQTPQIRQIGTAMSRSACTGTSSGRTFWDIAPDGASLVYAIRDENSPDKGLHIISGDGTTTRKLLTEGVYSPVWRVLP